MTTPHNFIREKTANIVPSMRWDGKEDFSVWQNRAKGKLNCLLGLPFQKCDDKFYVEYKEEFDNFTETRFVFQSEEGFFVPCHFWQPKDLSGLSPSLRHGLSPRLSPRLRPLVICLQGHTSGMHISMGRHKYPGDDNFPSIIGSDVAVRAIKEGCCALIIEQRCFGELGGTEKGPNCGESSMAALLIGRTIMGERVWDVQRALDAAERHFEFDKEKIICIGNSTGGATTFFASCLDPRIRYSVPSCYFCSFDDCIGAMHHCVCNYIPNIRLFFDMGDLAGLITPRPLIITAGKDDDIFPYNGVQKAFKEALRMYEGAGATDRIKLVTGDGGHWFYADPAWEALNFYLAER
ncbi:MAG: acetylxylan esterase [Treponema sp.]|nr:acetylxylan esterase [Treponema sp.]